jgi:hypothetical protein
MQAGTTCVAREKQRGSRAPRLPLLLLLLLW